MKDYFSNLQPQYDGCDKLSLQQSISVPISPSVETAVIMGVLDISKEAIRCFTEYEKCKEHEKTERKRIAATLRAIEYQIDAQKEVYLKELDKHYEERNRLYDIAERAQTKALELGDKEMLKLCYNMILDVYNKPNGFNGTSSTSFGDSFKFID